MKYLFALSLIIYASVTSAQRITLEKKWESNQQLPVPESVLVVEGSKKLYVSLIDGPGNTKDGKGGIAILNRDGSLQNASWVTGLNAPKGLAIYKNIIYVADLDVVHAIDIETAKILETVVVPGAVFLNDIAIDRKGLIYVSDTRTNKVHQIAKGESKVYLEGVTAANGLKVVNDDLYVLAGTELLKFDRHKNKVVIAGGFEKSGDGLEPLKDGSFIVTCWAGIIYHVENDGTKNKLLDVQGKMNTADIGYDSKLNMLYVPTFDANSVIAYQLIFK